MKKLLVILLGLLFAVTACRAQDAGSANNPAEVLVTRLVKAYQEENTEALRKFIWINAPKGGRALSRSMEEFARYDTITLVIKPISTVFFKKMGYENVEIKTIEEFRGVDVKTNSVNESSCISTFTLFKDFDGTYYILSWERGGSIPMIKIQKGTAPATRTN